MDQKEAIMQATIDLIHEKGEQMHEITVREICKRANAGLGLVNYHFGNKDQLIELCVERIINGIIDRFHKIQEQTIGMSPFDKLNYLGVMTLTFLFEHFAVAKISILAEMRAPREDDNTHRTYLAYLPLVSNCRPDWDEKTIARKTFYLITAMQQSFLRHKIIQQFYGIDLTDPKERKTFHTNLLQDLLEGPENDRITSEEERL